jgi:hypothetical protein
VKRIPLALVLAMIACSSSPGKPKAPPPAAPPAVAVPGVSPTKAPLSRTDPNIIEETPTGYIERLPKSQYQKVDDRHVSSPVVPIPIEFFKEDDKYYYVSVKKVLPEEMKVAEQEQAAHEERRTESAAQSKSTGPEVPLSDFEDLVPTRVTSPIRLESVKETGLPAAGMWRASFVISDINGDGIPDIVSPPARVGDGKLKVWIGDGSGRFTTWSTSFTENSKPITFSLDYGGVAVGDIDGDGRLDIVSASHGNGLVSLFGDGRGGFEVVRSGLPGKDFSTQAVTLVDANGDGRLDIVASRDFPNTDIQPRDQMEVRLYLFAGRQTGWELKKDAIVGGVYSNSVAAWDYDGDGKKDVVTGSNWLGGLRLLFRNQGDGTFAFVLVPTLEIWSYDFASAPGTYGPRRSAAFAGSYYMLSGPPANAKAAGISLYALEDGQWTRHRLWRKKDPKSSVYGLALGDLDGDGLDDLVFLDSDERRVRVLLQQRDGAFSEVPTEDEPVLDSPGQCVRLADLDRDGRLDIVVSKTVTAANPNEPGGWNVYLNRVK